MQGREEGELELAQRKAEVLTEALPWINKMRGKTVVVKYGGSAMEDPKLMVQVLGDIELLKLMGVNEQKAIRQLLGYREDTAGRIMTSEAATVADDATVADAVEMLRGLEGLYFPKDTFQFTEDDAADKTQQDFTDLFLEAAEKTYEAKEAEIGTPLMRELERVIMLRVVDEYWMDHIDAMDDLKQGIRLRAYANTDPVIAYKQESLTMFEEMVSAIQTETVRRMFSVRLKKDEEVKRERVAKVTGESGAGDGTVQQRPQRKVTKIGRNDPCPCGSGLKWKKCTCKEYHDN